MEAPQNPIGHPMAHLPGNDAVKVRISLPSNSVGLYLNHPEIGHQALLPDVGQVKDT
jgi:hypothetical protein